MNHGIDSECKIATVLIYTDGSAVWRRPALHENDVLNGERFKSLKGGFDWLGFYSWLRSSNGTVLGVRLEPDVEELPSVLLERAKAIGNEDPMTRMDIFFGSDHSVDQKLSNDGDFGGNAIFIGSLGTIAINFNSPR